MFDGSGRVLMQYRDNNVAIDYPGCWTVPGGGVEKGESFEQAARREFFEETGYHLASVAFLFSDDHWLPGGTMARRNFFWSVYDGVQEVRCYEGQALRFVSLREFSTMKIVPGLEETIHKALREWAAGCGNSSDDGTQIQH